jgi:FkbM family methyltransferase
MGFCSELFFPLFDTPFFRAFARFLVRIIKPKKDVLVEVHGHKMYANTLDRIIALYMWKFSALENFETTVLKDIIKDGMAVLDIGANIGYYTLKLAKLVGTKGKVYAFEPDPNNYSLLVKNLKTNNYENVIAMPKAVSDKTGKLKLFICEEHKGDHRIFDSHDGRKSIEIETVALDDFFFQNEKIDFIKMDIQGAEYLAFMGMEDLIQRNQSLIIITEFSPSLLAKSGFPAERLINKIVDYGYKLKFINEKKKSIDQVSSENLSKMCKGENYVSLYLAR